MDIKLVDATPNDYEFSREAHHQSYRDMVVRQFGVWDESVQDDFFDKTWHRLPHSIIIVNNDTSGYCCIQSEEKILWVRELVICPGKQNNGIGTTLINKFVQQGQREGIHVQLNVMKTNVGAKRLYEKLGFRIYGDNATHFFMRYEDL